MNGRIHGGRKRHRARGPIGFKAVMILVAGMALMVFHPSASQAREGIYLGFGVANQDIGGDLTSSATLQNGDGSHQARLGALEAGQGVSLTGGYGLTKFFALEFQLTISNHDAVFGPAPGTSQDAKLTSVLFGVRLNLPVGDSLELFGKLGIGGHELVFDQANFRTADNTAVDDVSLSGTGFGAGIGVTVHLGRLGVELGAMRHTVEFDAIDSLNFAPEFPPTLSVDVTTIAVLLTINFQ